MICKNAILQCTKPVVHMYNHGFTGNFYEKSAVGHCKPYHMRTCLLQIDLAERTIAESIRFGNKYSAQVNFVYRCHEFYKNYTAL